MRLLLPVVFFCLLSFNSLSQERITATFGNPTNKELNMSSYKPNPEANALVLFEKGNFYVEVVNDWIRLIKEVHVKTKVFDAQSFEGNAITIPLYVGGKYDEKLLEIEAITHNKLVKSYVTSKSVIDEEYDNQYNLKKFVFPKVSNGSVLEYRYKVSSPYFRALNGWQFQGDLPKLYSEIETKIPGNYIYNKSLVGGGTLAVNDVSLKEDCFWLPGFEVNADCEISVYAMKDIPAFVEEDYMLSPNNYMHGIDYTLKESYDFNGNKTEFTTGWNDVDKELRFDKDLGRQLGNKSFFKNNIPEGLLNEPNAIERAKGIFYFIQNHFSFNGKQRYLSDINVKEAFEEKVGNSGEINLALINALNATDIEASIVLISTRDKALPTKLYPQISDFNYALAAVEINNDTILLDATNKHLQFGMLPYKALNYQGRFLDFKKGSRWIAIEPYNKNTFYVNAQLNLGTDGIIRGKVGETTTGYYASTAREALELKGESDYIKEKQGREGTLEISNFTNENLSELEQPFKETYDMTFNSGVNSDKMILYPFFLKRFFDENPFKLEKRDFAVDFGHPFNHTYMLSLSLPEGYSISDIPNNRSIDLPNDQGSGRILYQLSNNVLNIRFTLKLKHHFTPEKYDALKDFFSTVVAIQNKEALLIEKI